MPHRYFTQDILGNFARITGPDAHHLARVMRAKEGDEITLCDGQGTDMTARVTDVGPEAVMLEVLDRTAAMHGRAAAESDPVCGLPQAG